MLAVDGSIIHVLERGLKSYSPWLFFVFFFYGWMHFAIKKFCQQIESICMRAPAHWINYNSVDVRIICRFHCGDTTKVISRSKMMSLIYTHIFTFFSQIIADGQDTSCWIIIIINNCSSCFMHWHTYQKHVYHGLCDCIRQKIISNATRAPLCAVLAYVQCASTKWCM